MDAKKCSKCEEVKPLANYYKDKRSKDGHRAHCKGCEKLYYEGNKVAIAEKCKRYYEKNKVTVAEQKKLYYEGNKVAIAEKRKRYYEENKESILEKRKQYNQANKESIAERRRQYYHANKSDMVQKGVDYARERRANDPLFRLTHNVRGLIGKSFTNGGFNKESRTYEILGCSHEEFYEHIENQFVGDMSWSRFDEIHIDHRLPLSAANTEEEILVLNHHRNLQPMWATDNLAKSDSYCPKELAAYFKKHLPT